MAMWFRLVLVGLFSHDGRPLFIAAAAAAAAAAEFDAPSDIPGDPRDDFDNEFIEPGLDLKSCMLPRWEFTPCGGLALALSSGGVR